jgi:hypothetical protein
MEFRNGALAALRANTGLVVAKLDYDSATALAQAIGELAPAGLQEEQAFRQPAQYLLFTVSRVIAEQQIAEILGKSWAGTVLRGMRDHEERRSEATPDHWTRNNPKNVAIRREEKRLLAEQKHLARLEIKKDRDRLWREKQTNDE